MNRESNRVEYKRELNSKLEKTVVAFLNNQEGGTIYLGISDNEEIIGLENPNELQLKIVDRIKNNILPSALGLFDVVAENREGKDIIKIIISSGPEKPYYLKKYGLTPTGCYIRVGNSVQSMTEAMISQLYASKTLKNNLRTIPSPRKDLSFAQLKIYYQENQIDLNSSFTKSLELLTPSGEYNYAAYLLADENNVSMKVVKYQDETKQELVENSEFGYCSIIKATNNILNKLEIENKIYTKITSQKRVESILVEKIALREAILNAIVHNDWTHEIPPLVEIFADKIVITSYGGLPQSLTEEEFFSGCSAPRNKTIMRIFKDLKLVEQIGSGMQRILSVYSQNIFDVSSNFIKITFPFGIMVPQSKGGQKTFILSGQKNNPSRGENGGQKTQVQGGQKNSQGGQKTFILSGQKNNPSRGESGGQKNSQGGQKTFILSGQKNNPSRGENGGQKTQVQGGQKNSALDLSNDNRQKLLQLIKQEPMISRKKLSDELQINESAIQKHLDYLKNEKIIIRKGGAKGGYWHLLKKDLYA